MGKDRANFRQRLGVNHTYAAARTVAPGEEYHDVVLPDRIE
ncbi:hypothetical protein RB2654_14215 [Rhodobacterales bacterium HTCC2654]|uniref:Uncharacterized protein n=1 Tax=Maritimibacter alkaliphilus HTCC2654 TaxID=314271 RepID=A3VGP2_9RHOB|nr:hypothetical protein RB2654_14215 [Rhodobacterales bacterium HTCC2654] [Maritimibacter alkaliphilus HTCC2654]